MVTDSQPRFKIDSQLYPNNTLAIVIDAIIVLLFIIVPTFLSHSILVGLIVGFFALVIVLSLSIRIVSEWNRKAVLKLGKYQGIIGPGLYTIIPLFEATPVTIDLRVISSTFRAEQTLSKDNVPVDVDAILFWQVKNPEKSILNVQSYIDSVQLAAQTALRDIIGKNDLSKMLAGRDLIGQDIKKLIEDRISDWGIDAVSVEIRDVKIPQELQNAMARVATSEREKMSRVILAESESLAADKMLEAAAKYKKDIYAMQLRALNMMYEISLNGKNVMIFIPTESQGFSMPTPLGIMGLQGMTVTSRSDQQKRENKKQQKGQTDNP